MNHYFVFDEFCLDTTNRRLFQKDVPVYLAPKSYDLLDLLVSNHGVLLKKEEILDDLWKDSFVEEANLTQHIYLLRKALKTDESSKFYIETFPTIGYRFTANVSELECDQFTPRISEYLDESASRPRSRFNRMFNNTVIGAFAVFLVLMIFSVIFVNYGYKYSTGLTRAKNINSLAVFPFRNIDGAKDQQLGNGLAETLISRLGKRSNILVRPAISGFSFGENSPNDVFQIGSDLSADAVLIGTIQCDGDLIRVIIELYRIDDKHQLWSETYDGRYSNLFALQDKISEQVSNKFPSDLKTKSGRTLTR